VKIKFDIGAEPWWARCRQEETSVECPDCGGTGRLRVTFHDETTVSIACQNCSRGYDPPTGRVRVHDRTPRAERVLIEGFEVKSDGSIEYRTSASYTVKEELLFDDYTGAMLRAEELAVALDREERERVATKERDTRSWAWNASYHRGEIKRCQKDIAYHEAKLAVASLKAKPAKPSVVVE
jgi:ribosomal protein S27E